MAFIKKLDIIKQSIQESDLIRNEEGKIRRIFVKDLLDLELINPDYLVEIYNAWMLEDEYLALRSEDEESEEDFIYRFIKASKRGNDVYRYLIKKRFKILEQIKEIPFFRDEFTRKKTRLLFVTLTYDVNDCEPIKSWYKIPALFNKFKANLTKQYGKIKVFRAWESTDKFYAHIHCLIYFEEHEFEVFHHDKNGRKTYRISFSDVKKIRKYYPFFIDIQGCSSVEMGLKEITKYIGKYLLKETTEKKPNKTNAMIWATNKQGYSISKRFFETIIGEEIEIEEPNIDDLKYTMCNSNFCEKKWEFIGLISAEELKINGKIWFVELKKPPPELKEIIDLKILQKMDSFGEVVG